MWQPYYVEWDFLVAINITCTVGIFWGLINTDLSFFSIFFLNPFAAEPPVTTRADPHPQLVSSVLSFASKRERTLGTRLPRPFYRLWRHQFWWSRTTLSSNFWRVKRSFTPYDNEHDSVKKTGEKVAWLPGSEIVELRKCEHPSFFLFSAPQLFAFLSLSRLPHYLRARNRHVDPKFPVKILFHRPPTSPFTYS